MLLVAFKEWASCIHAAGCTYARKCSGSLLVKVPSMSNRTPLIWLRSGTGGVMSVLLLVLLLLLRALTLLR
jgi:hypothetical protein